MRKVVCLQVVAVVLISLTGLAPAAPSDDAPTGTLVLGMGSYWRYHSTLLPVDVIKDGKPVRHNFGAWWLDKPSAPPAAGWMTTDFDDSGWHRMPAWNPKSPFIGLLCMRGKFRVTDPAKIDGLKLSLAYEGGVVVYLNGKEIARGHVPAGSTPVAPAETYAPVDAKKPQRNARTLEDIAIDPKDLRKGVNVLAIELHRATYLATDFWKERRNTTINFGNCGLMKIRLAAAETERIVPIVVRPKGLQVWNSDPAASDFGLDFGDPSESLKPIRLVTARNGVASGKVVVGSTEAIKGLTAKISDFRGPAGRIPASAAQIRFGLPGPEEAESRNFHTVTPVRFDGLATKAPEIVPVGALTRARGARLPDGPKPVAGAVVPVWVTVEVPSGAAAGEYRATMTIECDGAAAVPVPVKLRVCRWTVASPSGFRTFVEMVQSPESLAMKYKVEPYSAGHYELIAESLELLGQVGSKVCTLLLICDTNQGNDESMVRWIKQADGSYKHDFSILEKYLGLVLAHQGKPEVVCLYVWDTYLEGGRGGPEQWAGQAVKDGRKAHDGNGPIVSLLDPATGKVAKHALPKYADPASEALWRPVMDGVRKRLAAAGLTEAAMIGISTDNIPGEGVVDFFKKVCPRMPWVNHSHPYRTSIRKAPVGYSSGVWSGGTFANRKEFERMYGWRRAERAAHHPRSTGDNFPQTTWRFMGEMNITGRQRGFSRLGADFFPVLANRRGRNAGKLAARFPKSSWRNLNVINCLLAAGTDGPVATARFEMIREGLQACEARIFIEQALLDEASRAKLGDELATRSRKVLDERVLNMLRAVSTLRGRSAWTQHAYASTGWWQGPGVVGSHWFISSGWQDRLAELYAAAGEVEVKLADNK